MLNDTLRRDAAAGPADAERDGDPIAPLTETYPGLDVVDAYEIQLANIADRLADGRTSAATRSGCRRRRCSR